MLNDGKIKVLRFEHVLIMRFPSIKLCMQAENYFKTQEMLQKIGISKDILSSLNLK